MIDVAFTHFKKKILLLNQDWCAKVELQIASYMCNYYDCLTCYVQLYKVSYVQQYI